MSVSIQKANDFLKKGLYSMESGDYNDAIEQLRAAVAIEPFLHEASLRLGYLLHKTGFYIEAIPHLKKSAKATKNADAYYLLGHCYYLEHDHNSAQKAYEKALKINKNQYDALAGIGTILFDNGKYREARELIFPYIRNRRYNTNIANLYSRLCVKNNTCDELLDYLNDWLQIADSSKNEAVISQIYFLIGDIHDNRKNYTQALQSYILANSNVEKTYNPFELEKVITNIIDVYSLTFFMGCVTSGNNTRCPIFVVGMPRSGTSLVEQIISSHSQVFGAGELPLISDIKTEISILTGKQFPECMKVANSELLNQKADLYLSSIKPRSGKARYIVDKMPHNFIYLGLIYQLFPNCKIIHCIRNPVDTCLSVYSKSFNVTHSYSSDFDDLAHHYYHYQRIMEHWKCVIPDSIYEIKYENIIADSENEVRKLIHFCGLDWEDTCLNFHQTKRHVITASKDQVNKPLYTSSVARWKNYLPDIEPLIASLEKYGIHSEDQPGDKTAT